MQTEKRTSDLIKNYVEEYFKSANKQSVNEIPSFGKKFNKFAGAVAATIGFDYVGQVYFNKNTITSVRERLNKSFGNNYVELVKDLISNKLTEEFVKEQEGLLQDVNNTINKESDSITDSIMSNLVVAMQNGYVDTMYAIDVYNLLTKKTPTHIDILRINNMINSNMLFTDPNNEKQLGKGVITMLAELYDPSNELSLVKPIEKAVNVYDNIKMCNVMFEAILSLYEFVQKFGVENVIKSLTDDSFEFDTEPETTSDNHPVQSNEDLDKEIMSDPISTMILLLSELRQGVNQLPDNQQGHINNVDDFIEAFEIMCTDEESMGYFYQFIKKIHNTSNVDLKIPLNINVAELVGKLNHKLNAMKDSYKNSVESICQPLEEDKRNKINESFNDVIKYLMLEPDDVRQYLVSQFISPSVETYKHASEIMMAIEKSKIRCATYSLLKYKLLYENYNTLIENGSETSTSVSNQMDNINRLTSIIPLYDAMTNLLQKLTSDNTK